MPSTGFYLFLHYCVYGDIKRLVVCQCPQRASTYFFHHDESTRQFVICVNALNGLLLISSTEQNRKPETRRTCQCPQRASTYFFQRLQQKEESSIMCQCPQRASTYFFKIIYTKESRGKKKCQCPQRASTYFFALLRHKNT